MAVGSGSYDGGWSYSGGLRILDLRTGKSTSLLDTSREVLDVSWATGGALEIVLAAQTDEEISSTGVEAVSVVVDPRDWTASEAGSVRFSDLQVTSSSRPAAESTDALIKELRRLAALAGQTYVSRRKVWAVEALPDGSCLASLEGIAIERWDTSGHLRWATTTEGTGCQIILDPTKNSALINIERVATGRPPSWPPALVDRVDLRDGSSSPAADLASPVVLTPRSDGIWAARPTWVVRDGGAPNRGVTRVPVFDGKDRVITEIDLGAYDLFNHFFVVKRAPHLLFLEGKADKPWEDKWIVAFDSESQNDGHARRLFPLEWDRDRDGHLFGGPGVFITDDHGAGIVHAGAIHNGRGLLPSNAFVVRRSFPDGALRWQFRGDHQATALDEQNGVIMVVFSSGDIVALRTSDGEVLRQSSLRVGSHPVVPLSISISDSGHVAVGTLDGRVIRFTSSLGLQ